MCMFTPTTHLDPGIVDDGPTDNAPPAETTKVVEPKTRMEYFLNKIADAVNGEGGDTPVSGGMLVVNIVDDGNGPIFDKTAAQVYSALTTTGCVAVDDRNIAPLNVRFGKVGEYIFHTYFIDSNLTSLDFIAQNGDTYPAIVTPK